MEEKNPFEYAFGARDIFLTGATGMFGTALLLKITKDTTISQVHILVRGGKGTFLLRCYEWSNAETCQIDFGVACRKSYRHNSSPT
jgi:hypothetical protein